MALSALSKPPWLRVRLPGGERYVALKETVRRLDLHTVCEEAHCPNVGECWGEGTLTIMVLGDTCTRGCRFCAVNSGDPGGIVDPLEPQNTAQALSELDLRYVVLTMVDRDDLPDGGAAHVADTVRRTKALSPNLLVETLVGDFRAEPEPVRELVTRGRPDVFAHNVEVVPELTRSMRDARCGFDRSLDVLRVAREAGANVTKTSLMVGCGETRQQVLDAMARIREADVDVLTLGQYLRPSKRHAAVQRYVEPTEFDEYAAHGRELGFKFVASGPLVRSSYRAAEAFLEGFLRPAPGEGFDMYGKAKPSLKVVT